MNRSQPKRQWRRARMKCEQQGCRLCGEPAQAAHIIGREHDKNAPIVWPAMQTWVPYEVVPERICPLCPSHHAEYDAHKLDLLPYLTVLEQAQAVHDAKGIELARNRICGASLSMPVFSEAS